MPQKRARDGKENDAVEDGSPEGGLQRSTHGTSVAAVPDRRRSEQPAASKKPRASAAHANTAAAPDTEAKPLSERLAANRKREAQADLDQEEGSPAVKKPKSGKAKSAPGTGPRCVWHY